MAARLAPQGVSPLADDDGAALAERHVPADRLPGAVATTRRRRSVKPLAVARRGRSRSCCETYEKLGIPLNEQKLLAGVAVDASSTRCRSARRYKEELAKHGIIFCSFGEAVREHPELVRKYLGSVVPYSDNFFAALNAAVFSDGSFVLRPEGRALPDGAVDVLPHQRDGHGPVRAHADHRRRGLVRELPRGLHGAEARRRTSCTRRSSSSSRSRTRRSSTRPCRTGTPATRTAWAASTTS